MKASQLRDLTRRYAAGLLGRDEYLDERKRLIDAIVAGTAEIKYRDLDRASGIKKATRRPPWWITAGTLMLVGLLLAAIAAYFLDPTSNQEQKPEAVNVAPPNPAVHLLTGFLNQGNWTLESLESLESQWQDLSAFQQESARRSAYYRQLKHETGQRITEQEALLAAGEMDALLLAGRLREFAERMGFVDN